MPYDPNNPLAGVSGAEDDVAGTGPAPGADGAAASAGSGSGSGSAPVTSAVPAAYQPSYDPNNPTPYAAPVLPQTQQPIPTQLPDQQEPSQHELGAARTAGGVAYLGNQLLRGWVQGKAIRDARNAVKLHQQSTGLQSIYNDAAQQIQQLAQAGVSPESPEFQKAQQHVQASWQSLMDFYGQHVEPAGKGKDGQLTIMQKLQRGFQSQDPAQVSSAVYEGLQKTGPPVLHQIAPYLTPAYQAKVQQRAATAGATGEAAQGTAENQAELQRLLSLDNPTQQQQDRIMQLKYGIAKSTTLPPTMTWKFTPSTQSFKNPADGLWYKQQVNGLGQTRMQAMGADYQPTKAEMGEVPGFTFPGKDGTWYKYSMGRDGKPDPKTVAPISASVAAGPTNKTTDTLKAVVQPDGSTVLVPVQSTSTTTHGAGGGGGGTGAGQPLPPGVEPAAAAATSPSQPGAAPAPASPAVPAPRATSSPAGASASAATSASPPAALSQDATRAARAFHPQAGGGGARVLGPGTTVGGKIPPQELQSMHAMEDTMPIIKATMAMLEPAKSENGLLDWMKQRGSYMGYKAGFNTGTLQTALNQYASFVKVAGASPWSKVGRGKYIYQQVLEHLPDPSKDTPSLMYQKLDDLRNIFHTEMGVTQQRMSGMTLGGGQQQGGSSAPSPAIALPPQARSQLKPGHVTTFANGQKWQLNAKGEPEQVTQ